MLDEKDLAAIATLLDAKLDTKLDAKLGPIEANIAQIKETQAEHTASLNALIEWADECREAYKFPLPKLM